MKKTGSQWRSTNNCPYCHLLKNLHGRRLFFDEENFIVLDDLSSLCPILVYNVHGQWPACLQQLQDTYEKINWVGSKLYGADYFLATDIKHGHYSVLVKPL